MPPRTRPLGLGLGVGCPVSIRPFEAAPDEPVDIGPDGGERPGDGGSVDVGKVRRGGKRPVVAWRVAAFLVFKAEEEEREREEGLEVGVVYGLRGH